MRDRDSGTTADDRLGVVEVDIHLPAVYRFASALFGPQKAYELTLAAFREHGGRRGSSTDRSIGDRAALCAQVYRAGRDGSRFAVRVRSHADPLRDLPSSERDVVAWALFSGCATQEIAAGVGLGQDEVCRLIRDGLRRLSASRLSSREASSSGSVTHSRDA